MASPALVPPRPVSRSSSTLLRWGVLSLLLTVVALGAVILSRPKPVDLPLLGAVPPFRFTRQDGKAFGSADLAGRPWVANFIFTRCPTICPLFTQKFAAFQGQTASLGEHLKLVSFSVDPTYDTPERLAAYATRFGANPARWSFLTGDDARLKEVIVGGFKVSMGRDSTKEEDVLGIFHGTHFVLVDGAGQIRGYYDSDDASATERLLQDAEALSLESQPPRSP